jgi:multidrug resistance efflux pump
MTIKRGVSLLVLLVFLFPAGCTGLNNNTNGSLKASGTTSIVDVQVAPEISGTITQIKAAKGDQVLAGELLFTLDSQLLQAQVAQENAAVQAAQSNLDLAQNKLASAQAQYDLAVQTALQQNQPNRIAGWKTIPPDNVSLPGWYFAKSEQVIALQGLLDTAQKNLDDELANLDSVLKGASNQDFVNAEKRLDQAEQAYTIAQTTLDDAKAAQDTNQIQDAAQKALDSATSELDSAQNVYNAMLSSDEATRVLESRAQVAVAQDQLTNTQAALNNLQTGDQSLQVTSAQAGLDQAKNAVSEAQAGLAQAQSALELAKIQLSKALVTAPVSGTVLSQPMNAGEVVAAGATVVEVGDLDQITLDVYIPENQYGRVQLGQAADVVVDSFPGQTFTGKVTFIADQAEFTPRTVQTVDSRSTTVYKVEITIPNSSHDLKPGMPADATILTP